MKGPSEGIVSRALRSAFDDEPNFVYKPPDDARNWKPCDFMVWWYLGGDHSAWVEAKQTPNKTVFNIKDIRTSQESGIRTAMRLRIPYLLVIRWKSDGMWSIVDAVGLFDWLGRQLPGYCPTSVERVALESRWGVSCATGQLSSMLRAALIEGL